MERSNLTTRKATDVLLSRVPKLKCNILIVNVIYGRGYVGRLRLLSEDEATNAGVACLSVVHVVLGSTSVRNDVT